jgi:hypothetical protein
VALQSGLRQRGCLNGTAGAVALLLGALLARGLTGVAPARPRPAQPGQGAPPFPPAPSGRIEPAPRPPRGGAPVGDDVIRERSGVRRGVVRPPSGVDPGIHMPAPNPTPNTTPVLPLRGKPGGDPRVQPK